MNRQYRDAYVDVLARVIPSWEHHRGFRFSWERQSVVAKQNFRQNSSSKGRKCSKNLDQRDREEIKDQENHRVLTAIPEGCSSKSGDDDVFHPDPAEKDIPKTKVRTGPPLPTENTTVPLLNGNTHPTDGSKEHWVAPDGSTGSKSNNGDIV